MTLSTTHFIINYLIGKKLSLNKILLFSFVIGGIAPDIDAIPLLFSYDLYLQIHRVWFHSVFAGVFFGVLFVALLYLFMRNKKINYSHAFLFFNFGFWMHLLWDFISIDKMNIIFPFGEFWVGIDLLGSSSTLMILFDSVVLLVFLAIYRLKFLEDFKNIRPKP